MNLFVFADKFTGIKRGMVRSSSWVSSKTFSWSGWKALGQPPTVGICSSRYKGWCSLAGLNKGWSEFRGWKMQGQGQNGQVVVVRAKKYTLDSESEDWPELKPFRGLVYQWNGSNLSLDTCDLLVVIHYIMYDYTVISYVVNEKLTVDIQGEFWCAALPLSRTDPKPGCISGLSVV